MKKRLDVLTSEKGIFGSREKAKAGIMAGLVLVDGQVCDKPGMSVCETAEISLKEVSCPYVSRGGLKLEKALKTWGFSLEGTKAVDIGASTGGFTDCMLRNGAGRVYCIDVGYGQLDWKLRQDERVVCMEKTNFRYMTPEDIPDVLDFASVDVSFISLDKILTPAYALLKEQGEMVALIKPQFEAGREKVGKKGVVREPKVHEEVMAKIVRHADEVSFEVLGLSYSPIRGPEGNIEYLIHLRKNPERTIYPDILAVFEKKIKEIVEDAHRELEKS